MQGFYFVELADLYSNKIGLWFHLYLSCVSTVHIVSVCLSYQVLSGADILCFVNFNLAV